MDMIAWILLCLFASVGIVQCGTWLLGALWAPARLWYGFYVVPIRGGCEGLEAQARQATAQIRWNGSGCQPVLLVVDGALDEESQAIVRALSAELDGVTICTRETLADVLELPGLLPFDAPSAGEHT